MDMVWHQMTFHDSTLLLAGQFMKNRPQKLANFAKHHLAPIFGHKNHMVFAVPLGVRQALIEFRHCFVLLRMYGSSHRGRYFTAGTLKACRVALVKPVAYLRYSVSSTSPGPFSQFWEKGSEWLEVPLPKLGEGFRVRAKGWQIYAE
jgi:hypothetical protein